MRKYVNLSALKDVPNAHSRMNSEKEHPSVVSIEMKDSIVGDAE